MDQQPANFTTENAKERFSHFLPSQLSVLIPILSIVLICFATTALIWIAAYSKQVETREKLIRDTLWVEQNLRFQLSHYENIFHQQIMELSFIGSDPQRVENALRHLVTQHPEILSVVWRDHDRVKFSHPLSPQQMAMRGSCHAPSNYSERVIYSAPYNQGNDWRIDLAMRIPENNVQTGMLCLTLSLPLFIEHNLPWWVSRYYRVAMVLQDETVITPKASVVENDSEFLHRVSFSPPLIGTFIELSAYGKNIYDAQSLWLYGILALLCVIAIYIVVNYRHSRKRLEIEKALRAETAFRKSMEDSLTIGMRARDHKGKILYVNRHFCHMVGLSERDIVGHTPPLPYWDVDEWQEAIKRQKALAKDHLVSRSFESRFRHSSGRLVDVLVYEAPLIDADNNHIGWMGSIIDITERKKLALEANMQADKLQHTARLITMGEMISTLAHELNQPLAAISSYAHASLKLLTTPDTNKADIEAILQRLSEQAKRAGRVVHHIHEFVRKRETQMTQFDLVQMGRDMTNFIAPDLERYQCKIAFINHVDKIMVSADQVLLEQVLLNLIRNGIEAMADTPPAQRLIRVEISKSNNRAIICVVDQGSGVAENMQDEIFKPFMSTKQDTMGMGLAICKSILEIHKGHLHYTHHNQETIFTISLPL